MHVIPNSLESLILFYNTSCKHYGVLKIFYMSFLSSLLLLIFFYFYSFLQKVLYPCLMKLPQLKYPKFIYLQVIQSYMVEYERGGDCVI